MKRHSLPARSDLTILVVLSISLVSGCGPAGTSRGTTSETVESGNGGREEPATPHLPAIPLSARPGDVPGAATADRGSNIRFRQLSEQSGVTFLHRSGNSPAKEFPTCLGSGVALLDYDGDGWLDIYLATTRNLPLEAPDNSQGNRLYRNRHDGTFEDVTARAGVGFHGFCHGLAVADVDNDGRPDLYLCNLGPDVLYLNNGDGTFRDATASAGIESQEWSCGAAFLDFDNDGKVDLYVSNYGEWSADAPKPYCGDKAKNLRTICSPLTIKPIRHVLYHNRGNATFEDVTERAGVGRHDGRGLGVIAADLNRDGKIDLYVANDKCPNFLFLNRGDGTFEDASETSGAAGNEAGEFQGSMGVDAEDVDGDGWPELVVTNFRGEGLTVYHNLKGGNFLDVSSAAGVIPDSKPYVGWGVSLGDFDGDGWPDLLAVSGHVDDNLPLFGTDIPQAEPAKLWRNPGVAGRRISFQLVANPGPFFSVPHVARGAAFGDLDNDGDIDVVVSRLDALPAILINESLARPWIRLSLVGHRSNRSAIGASVEVHTGTRVIRREVKGGGSYLSANDSRILVGLGDAAAVDRVEIKWPSGLHSTLTSPALGMTHVVHEPEAPLSSEWKAR
jgi:hypothetical protein